MAAIGLIAIDLPMSGHSCPTAYSPKVGFFCCTCRTFVTAPLRPVLLLPISVALPIPRRTTNARYVHRTEHEKSCLISSIKTKSMNRPENSLIIRRKSSFSINVTEKSYTMGALHHTLEHFFQLVGGEADDDRPPVRTRVRIAAGGEPVKQRFDFERAHALIRFDRRLA